MRIHSLSAHQGLFPVRLIQEILPNLKDLPSHRDQNQAKKESLYKAKEQNPLATHSSKALICLETYPTEFINFPLFLYKFLFL